MAISVVVPRALTPYTRGAGTLVVEEPCTTVGDALAAIAARLPALTDRVLTEQGEIRRHVNVFVGDESVRFLDGLGTRVEAGTVITIVPAVSGG
ncbi:MAG: molybdopterin synthase sulfur carrier subunit [Gemmatimonadaceae bacterium]|nr:molybdopterin synthase sulfur carrier subunit [Gemmatimonadaceae bacterium]